MQLFKHEAFTDEHLIVLLEWGESTMVTAHVLGSHEHTSNSTFYHGRNYLDRCVGWL